MQPERPLLPIDPLGLNRDIANKNAVAGKTRSPFTQESLMRQSIVENEIANQTKRAYNELSELNSGSWYSDFPGLTANVVYGVLERGVEAWDTLSGIPDLFTGDAAKADINKEKSVSSYLIDEFRHMQYENAQAWAGELSFGRKAFHWTHHVVFGVGEFILGGKAGGGLARLMSKGFSAKKLSAAGKRFGEKGTGNIAALERVKRMEALKAQRASMVGHALGVDAVLAQHANSYGSRIYDETGNAVLASSLGVLNFIVSKTIFTIAKKPLAKTQKQIQEAVTGLKAEVIRIIRGVSKKEQAKLVEAMATGNGNVVATFIQETSGVVLSATALRTVEWAVGSYAKDFMSPHVASETLDRSRARLMDVVFSGMQEGFIIKFASAVQGTGSAYLASRAMAKQGMTRQYNQLLNEQVRLSTYHLRLARGLKGDVNSLQTLLDSLMVKPTDNLLEKQLKESLTKAIDAIKTGKGEVEIESIAAVINKMPIRDQIKMYREFGDTLARVMQKVGLEDFVNTTDIGQTHRVVDRLLTESQVELMETMTKVELEALPPADRLQFERQRDITKGSEKLGSQVRDLPEASATVVVLRERIAELNSRKPKDEAEAEAILRETESYQVVVDSLLINSGISRIDAITGRTDVEAFESRQREFSLEAPVHGKPLKGEKALIEYFSKRNKDMTPEEIKERDALHDAFVKELFGAEIKGAKSDIRKKIVSELNKSLVAKENLKGRREDVRKVEKVKFDKADFKTPESTESSIGKITDFLGRLKGGKVETVGGKKRKSVTAIASARNLITNKASLIEKTARLEKLLASKSVDPKVKKEIKQLKRDIKELEKVIPLERAKALQELLKRRKDDQGTWANDALDSLLMHIYKSISKKTPLENTTKEVKLEEAVERFVEHMGEAYRPLGEKIKEIVEQIDAVDSIKTETWPQKTEAIINSKAATTAEVDLLIESVRLLHGATEATAKIKRDFMRSEDAIIADNVHRNLDEVWSGKPIVEDPLAPGRTVRQESLPGWELIKNFTYGIEGAGRLTDIAEYLGGGNNTLMHKVLYRDVHTGKVKAEDLHQNNLRVLTEKLGEKGITLDDVIREHDSNPANIDTRIFSKRRGQPIESRLVKVSFSDGSSVTFTRGEVMNYWVNSKDATTPKEFGKSNIRFKDRNVEAREWSSAKHKEMLDYLRKNHGDLIEMADAFFEAMNDVRMTQPLNGYTIKHHGVGIVSGKYWPRERHFEGQSKDTINKIRGANEINAHSVGESSYRDFAVGETSPISLRTGATHDIVIRDIYDVFSDYSFNMSNVVHTRDAMNSARRLIKNERIKKLLGKHGLEKLLTGLDKNYYNHQIREMTGVGQQTSTASAIMRKAINLVTQSTLSLHPGIMAYQKLSLAASATHFGLNGGADIATVEMRMKTSDPVYSKKALLAEGMENSAMFQNRVLGSAALAISQGTKSVSSKKSGIRVGNKVAKNKNIYDYLGMQGINYVDISAITTIYGASKIRAERILKERGINVKENAALHRKLTKKLFEENVVETQPMFDPIYQPAMINWGRESVAVKAVNMFRGYTGKLVAQQRMAVTRFGRARTPEQQIAAMSDMVGKTLVSSLLIPIIRTAVNGAFVALGSAMLGLESEEHTPEDVVNQLVSYHNVENQEVAAWFLT